MTPAQPPRSVIAGLEQRSSHGEGIKCNGRQGGRLRGGDRPVKPARRVHRQFRHHHQDPRPRSVLASLPGGNCSCPHWGYVLKGRVVVRYADRQETLQAGDAFYMPPGHAPEAEEGTELIQFSPTEQLAEVEAAIAAAVGRS